MADFRISRAARSTGTFQIRPTRHSRHDNESRTVTWHLKIRGATEKPSLPLTLTLLLRRSMPSVLRPLVQWWEPPDTQTLSAKTLKAHRNCCCLGTVTSSATISIANGTVITATLTASTACTFTMPTATAGKSFVLLLKQAASTGNGMPFTGVKWPALGAADDHRHCRKDGHTDFLF